MAVTELLEKVFLLTSTVESLKTTMMKIETEIMSLRDRVVRLEAGGELIAEKAKNAAMAGAVITNNNLAERVVRLEMTIDGYKPPLIGPNHFDTARGRIPATESS